MAEAIIEGKPAGTCEGGEKQQGDSETGCLGPLGALLGAICGGEEPEYVYSSVIFEV